MIRRLAVLFISVAVRCVDAAVGSVRRRHTCRGVVLYYHAVKPHQRQRFARQMDALLERAHPFPAGSPDAMRPGTTNAAVTFDDGFCSVAQNAVPELAKRGIPFTLFVPSGCLGRRPSWVHSAMHPAWEERVLSAAELRELARVPLATLGSHSVTHPDLRRLAASDSRRELAESKRALEQASGAGIDLFSFPHGAHSAALVAEARRAGYRRVFTIEPAVIESRHDHFTIGRVAADPEDWPIEFHLKLAGAYRWRQRLHRRRLAVETPA